MAEPSPSTVPPRVSTFGPAGSTPDVRNAGQDIMDNFCDHYPDTNNHSAIPHYFGGKITELMEPRANLTRREEGQIR